MPRRSSAPPALTNSAPLLGSGPSSLLQKEENYDHQPFTNQSTGQRGRSLKFLSATLDQVAGSSQPEVVGSLVSAYLTSRKGKLSKEVVEEALITTKLDQIINNVRLLHAQTPTNDRNSILSVLTRVIPRATLNIKHGFSISAKSYTKSRSRDVGAYPRKRGPPANKLPNDTINRIREFFYLDSVTREAANRTVKVGPPLQKVDIPVRYMQDSKSNLHQEFIEKHRAVSRKAFDKYTPKEVKKCKRDTDKCTICTEGVRLRAVVAKMQGMEALTAEQHLELDTARSNLVEIDEHVALQKTIRKVYKKQKMALPIGSAMIVMDFKDCMKLGKATVEINRNFYDTPQRSVFTIAVITRQAKSNVVEDDLRITYFTFVSETLKHDTAFVFDCLKQAQEHRRWKKLLIQSGREINIWVDNAPQHFRTFEFMYEFQAFSQKRLGSLVHLNYFAEYHGKCICDSHFSLLSRFYRDHSMRHGSGDRPIHTTKEFIRLLQRAVLNSNKAKRALNDLMKEGTKRYKPLCVIFQEYKRAEVTSQVLTQVKTANFTSFYHFQVFHTTEVKNKRVIIARLHRDHPETHEYPIVITKMAEQSKISKQGWSESRAKPFTIDSLRNKKTFRQKVASPAKRKSSRALASRAALLVQAASALSISESLVPVPELHVLSRRRHASHPYSTPPPALIRPVRQGPVDGPGPSTGPPS